MDQARAQCAPVKEWVASSSAKGDRMDGVTYDISNKHRLVYPEVKLVQNVIDGVNMLYKEDVALWR